VPVAGLLAISAAALGIVAGPTAGAFAKGGTAKPVPGATATFTVPTLSQPAFSTGADQIHGFDETGFVQSATVSDASCPGQTQYLGGTATINGNTVTIPCNTIVQMPANTLSWDEFVGNPASNEVASFPAGTSFNSLNTYAAYELHVVGNYVGSKRIAALAFASQQSTNSGSGTITGFDYAKGIMKVASGGAADAIVQINDPTITDSSDPGFGHGGRFSAGQSPDSRYSVDQENPTVHAGTGYPMCIPRTDPAAGTDDPLCPQANRPKPAGATATAAGHCRDFADDATPLPASGNLSSPAVGQAYCSQFVMPAAGTTGGPDPRQQAPLEKGDFVAYSGTLQHDPSGGPDYISANTIEANVGIYTHHGSQPAYMAIGEFGVGTADPNAVAAGGVVNQETQDRLFLESETTDPSTLVDIYMVDVDGKTGTVRNRWVTTPEMTGAAATNTADPTTGGGIATMSVGPQPQRARIRANKAPTGLLSQPTRTIRVMQRSLCKPTMPDMSGTDAATNEMHPKTSGVDTCLAAAAAKPVANGLVAGQYLAPTFEFIFPENVRPGDPVVPNDMWHLPFLRYGEGPGQEAALAPLPW
jgi:hypothetical protein